MTDRLPLAQHTKASLDTLYERAERAEAEASARAEADSADAAAGSYALRAERVEAQLTAVADLIADHEGDDWAAHPATAALRDILDSEDYAIAQPEPWLHIAFTSPDETSANTSALALRDHLRAEFDGVRMRITTNATEGEPNSPAATEATDIETTARVFAALHRSAEETVTRVIDLYEQWVKAGAPPLGTSMARWWDARLVELREAIRPAAEQSTPAATEATVRPTLRERHRAQWLALTDPERAARIAALDEDDQPEQPGRTTPDNPVICELPHQTVSEEDECERARLAPADGTACSCGGRFPIHHLHADEHRPVGEPAAWTPPPPGDRREQLPDAILALLDGKPYLSTACDTAQQLEQAPAPIPTSGGAIPNVPWYAERMHARCRLQHKFTGQPCSCPCHQPDATDPADLAGAWMPDPPIRCLTVTTEPDPFGYEERERTGRNAGLVIQAATEATDTWKEPAHPHPCTAAIEGRATPGGCRVQCTREARHPENHVGPKQGANGRVLWTDHQAGATPHKEQP